MIQLAIYLHIQLDVTKVPPMQIFVEDMGKKIIE